ncbi:MAG: ester cyclase, partial [Melioribacteraceae bacterium]|nr:ester cyclase [Melioribacteraceae bacterium]
MSLKMLNELIIILLLLAITVIFTAGCQQQQDYSKELKPIVERGVEVWNTGNLDVVDELWTPNIVRSANQQPDVEGIDGYKDVITSFRTAYPDAQLTIDEEVYSENKVILRWTYTGTNTGEGEIPP